MKQLLFILALQSTTAWAQNSPNDKQAINIHYEKASMGCRSDSLFTEKEPGDMYILDGILNIPGPIIIDTKRQSNLDKNDNCIVEAHHVRISDASNLISIEADILKFSNGTKKGNLTGNIIKVENGRSQNIGQRAEIDLSKSQYSITNIQ